MSIRSLLGNWIAQHNQLLWFRSNGQRLERSQVPQLPAVSSQFPDSAKSIRIYCLRITHLDTIICDRDDAQVVDSTYSLGGEVLEQSSLVSCRGLSRGLD